MIKIYCQQRDELVLNVFTSTTDSLYNSCIGSIVLLGLVVRPRSICWRGSSSPILLGGKSGVKELSVFIDESGDFGEYASHSPYYIITMVFHDQSIPITEAVHRLDQEQNTCFCF